jgi:hypothetical protein
MVAIMVYVGIRPIFFAVMAAACFVWNFWGKRMAMRDPKLVIVVNIETKEIRPIRCGRKLWERMTKKGKPQSNFRTPGGLSVEGVRSFDPGDMMIEYPHDDEYSDIAMMALPERYGALIDELVKLRKRNYELEIEGELTTTRDGIKKAQNYAGKLNEIVEDTFIPKEKAE